MRVFLIVTLTAFLVGSAHAQTQRPRSRLSQMFNNLVDDMNDVASRIGHGFLRTLNGPGSASRERPIVPRQQNQINGPARQQDENAIAPNDPAVRPSPGSLRQRPRLSFRQFVDGVMSGISNLMPRLRRRVFSRHNNRAGQVSQGQRRIKRRALEIVQEIPDSEINQSGVTVSSSVKVTVNIIDGKQKGSPPSAGDDKDQYTVSYTEPPALMPEGEIHIMYHPSTDVEVTKGPDEYPPENDPVFVHSGSPGDDHMTENDWPPFSSWLHSDGYVFNDDETDVLSYDQIFEPVKLPDSLSTDDVQEDESYGSPVTESSDTRISGGKFMVPGFRGFDISPASSQRFGIIDHPGYYDDISLGSTDFSHHHSGSNNHGTKVAFDTDNTDVLSSVFLSHMYDAQGTESKGNKRKHTDSYPLGFKEGFLQGFNHGFEKGQTETSFSHQTLSSSESNTHPNNGIIKSPGNNLQSDQNRQPVAAVNSFSSFNTQSGTQQQSHHSRPSIHGNNRPNFYNRQPITNSHTNAYNRPQFNNKQPSGNYQVQINHPVTHNPHDSSHMFHYQSDNQPSFTNIDQAHDNNHYRPNFEHKDNQEYIHPINEQNVNNEQINPFSNWVQSPHGEGFSRCDGRCMWNQLIQYLDHFSGNNSESRGS